MNRHRPFRQNDPVLVRARAAWWSWLKEPSEDSALEFLGAISAFDAACGIQRRQGREIVTYEMRRAERLLHDAV